MERVTVHRGATFDFVKLEREGEPMTIWRAPIAEGDSEAVKLFTIERLATIAQ
jgi:hypothetical protein